MQKSGSARGAHKTRFGWLLPPDGHLAWQFHAPALIADHFKDERR